MATSTFSFTNTSNMSKTITPIDVKPITCYGVSEDTATSCELTNKTSATGIREKLSYQATEIKSVSTKNTILAPGKVTSGINMAVRLDEILHTVDAEGLTIQDDPVVMLLQVRCTNSPYVTADHVVQVFKRLIGACMREDGTFRFDDLMVSALKPVAD